MNLEQCKEKMFAEKPEVKEEYEKMVDHDFVKGLGERVAAGIEDSMKLHEIVKEIGMERILELVEADRNGKCIILKAEEGDIVYVIAYCITGFPVFEMELRVITEEFKRSMAGDIGRIVFYTREEAEQALKKMKEEQKNG